MARLDVLPNPPPVGLSARRMRGGFPPAQRPFWPRTARHPSWPVPPQIPSMPGQARAWRFFGRSNTLCEVGLLRLRQLGHFQNFDLCAVGLACCVMFSLGDSVLSVMFGLGGSVLHAEDFLFGLHAVNVTATSRQPGGRDLVGLAGTWHGRARASPGQVPGRVGALELIRLYSWLFIRS